MPNFTNILNFSQTPDHSQVIKLHNRNRKFGYYFDNLCLYCANNGIDLDAVSDDDFSSAVEIMEAHGTKDMSTDHYYFWINK